jgi:putative ATP-dependent endonuclease of OLD family
MPGQKMVATHSGDLLARVPLTNLRRFCHHGGRVVVKRLLPGTLGDDDMRKIGLHVRATRGELLFARSWLLVDGATEVWLFEGIAEVLGYDLERQGVRIVQYRQVEVTPFVRLADALGIAWFCLADGDQEGAKCRDKVAPLLGARSEAKHFLALPERNVELHLCANGFGTVFVARVPAQKRASITAPEGQQGHWDQVVGALPGRGKETRVIEVVEEMRRRGVGSVPPALKGVLDTAITLAGDEYGP